MEQPCRKDCPERSADCHAKCPRYREYEKARNEGYAERETARRAADAMFDAKERIKRKNFRNTGKWGWG